jgi:hypothetical protein
MSTDIDVARQIITATMAAKGKDHLVLHVEGMEHRTIKELILVGDFIQATATNGHVFRVPLSRLVALETYKARPATVSVF